MNKIKVSFVIITWDGLHYICNLLKSMEHIIAMDDVEVILVDNGSQDGTVSYVKRVYPRVLLMELSVNRGVAYARNRGMQVARGEYICIIDNDVVMKDEVFVGVLAYMDEHPDVGLAGCALCYEDGTLQDSCKKYPGLFFKLGNLLRLRSGYCYQDKMQVEPFEPVYVIGAFQWFRREAFEQAGLLDENIFYGPEDCDFCMRIHAAGWKIMYLPQYRLVHHCQRMTNHRPFSKMGMRHIFGLLYLYWKYKRLN